MVREIDFSWRVGLALVALLAATSCSPRRSWEAALVLVDLEAGREPSRLKATTPEPRRQVVRFAVGQPVARGDLYLPAQDVLAALVLVPGAAEQGKDDPRLVAFATTLARARFAVLVPDIVSLRELKVTPENIHDVAATLRQLQELPVAKGRPLGAVAFSYAVGPTLLAAAEPPLADGIDFILAVGGYYDLEAVLTFATTGYFRRDGQWRWLQPNRYGKWVFVKSNLDRLEAPADRRLFQRMIERKENDLEAAIDDLATGLTPSGKTLYRFVSNTDPRRVEDLLAALPAEIRADIAALDLSRKNLSALQARLILVHGKDDPIIPHSESLALAAALPPDQVDVFLVRGLMHVDMEPGLYGSWRLWQAILALLRERDEVDRK